MPVQPRGSGREAVAVLGSSAMRGPLQDFLRSRSLTLDGWEHLRSHHRPGGAVSALYRVHCRPVASTGSERAGNLALHLGATTPEVTTAAVHQQVARARIAGLDLSLWIHPHDPVLRSLPWATDGDAVGLEVFSSSLPAHLSLAAYRPLRRAVVRAEHRQGPTAYLKLLPAAQLPALRRRHQLLEASSVPAPLVVPTAAAEERGALVLSALPGTSLFRLLVDDGAAQVRPEVLLEVLDGLPVEALDLPPRPSWARRAEEYAAAAAAVLPGEAGQIRTLARGIREAVDATDAGPLVPVHGDFHEGNLLLAGGRITGLLDVDGLGPGHRVDDLACLLGHLAVLAAANPGRPQLGQALVRFRRVFADVVEPASLNAHAAGVVLTLVAGARAGNGVGRSRNAGVRLAAAQRLLEAAREER